VSSDRGIGWTVAIVVVLTLALIATATGLVIAFGG